MSVRNRSVAHRQSSFIGRAAPPVRRRRADRDAGAGHQPDDPRDVAARLGVAACTRRPRPRPGPALYAASASGTEPNWRSRSRMNRACAWIACSGSNGFSSPNARAVAGMNCAMPCAPALRDRERVEARLGVELRGEQLRGHVPALRRVAQDRREARGHEAGHRAVRRRRRLAVAARASGSTRC